MRLKQYDRVIYTKNTIQEVICQLRFPTTLKINSPDIALFQEAIKAKYPEYLSNSGGFPPAMAEMLAQSGMPNMGFMRGEPEHHFLSENQKLKLVLQQNSLTLITDTYTRFESFLVEFEHALGAMVDIFTPPYFTRVGLRYKNFILRPYLGLTGCPWKELIPNTIAPELYSADYSDKVLFFEKKLHLKEGNEQINMSHSLVQATGLFRGQEFKDEEIYTIDADAFSEVKNEPTSNSINTILREFNVDLRNLFRASIMDKLHNAMEPTTPSS